ncbi:2-dehydropantoate 2-reductase N-terminal domain-containing protein [Pandoraea pnomenusa]|uniref:2-dehydropantoate 2-reductase N-terminal domain-containing protein n=1 Tax=Pandoraea pnomenusa TaxID=93220 RepID=UPI003CF5FAE9
MKVTIIGAGAIGGLLGTKLAAAGEAQVSALAPGVGIEDIHPNPGTGICSFTRLPDGRAS